MKTWIVVPYALASFVAASLLFTAEPMIGKMALPPLGGTPSVWNTCLLYFQTILLVGYLLALAASRLDRVSAAAVLVVLAILLFLGDLVQPIAINLEHFDRTSIAESPASSLLSGLLLGTALPLVLVSSTSPLTQHWFARTGHPRAHDPYFLYAASNAGSLLALLAYPIWVEPSFSLTAQTRGWRLVYCAFAIPLVVCGAIGRPRRVLAESAARIPGSETVRPMEWLGWIALSAIPSSWLLGVTTFLTTNIAAMPLLWVIPLALFLVSSIIAFSESTRRSVRTISRLFPWMVLAVVLVQLAGFVHAVWLPLHLATFFLGCLVCNVRLAESRPAAARATSFYLAIAVGGVLGGAFNALVAPALFSGVAEYPLAILCGALAYPIPKQGGEKEPLSVRDLKSLALVPVLVLVAALPVSLGLFDSNESLMGAGLLIVASGLGVFATMKAGERPFRFGLTVGAILLVGLCAADPAGTTSLRSRDFYGVVRVTVDREADCRRLLHGVTLHGEQSLDPNLREEPRTYFTRSGPVGDIFERRKRPPGGDVAIVGLGIGTLAAYAQPGERWTFYELDPTVVRIARDPSFFTYLASSRARDRIFVTGDARVRIREANEHQYAVIVLDAFGSDAVPVHLITREAIQRYLTKLAPGGILVFNITNGYLDLEPVIGLQARDAGLVCRVRRDVRVSAEERRAGRQGSIWAVMGRAEADLSGLGADTRWKLPRIRDGARPWTDDYSDLASYLLILGRRESSEANAQPRPPADREAATPSD